MGRIVSPGVKVTEADFWARIEKTDSCWLWCGGRFHRNYGWFGDMSAHRYSWQLAHGRQIPAGMYVCHTCDNPRCVNPDHLFLGTPADNTADMVAKGRATKNYVYPEPLVAQMFALHAEGVPNVEISRRLGIPRKTVWKIIKHKPWRRPHELVA